MSLGRMALVLAGLFCCVTAVMLVMNRNNPNLETEGLLAESFYYTAIGFAVYHLYNRAKQNRDKQ